MYQLRIFSLFTLCLIYSSDLVSCRDCPRLSVANGRVRLRNNGQMATFICNGGFAMVGARFAICLGTGMWNQKTPKCVGTGCRPVTNIPNMDIESLHGGAMLKFSCLPGYYREGPEEIFCDGDTWSSMAPTCAAGVNLACDFETEGMCGWSQDQTDNFDWTWHKGHTPTTGTGPAADHTTNSANGHYIYIESSAPAKKDYKARLVSPLYQPRELADYCLEFFYHMKGPDTPGEMGHLDVYVQPESIPTSMQYPSNVIFNVEGNQGDEWHKADVEIPPSKEPFKIVYQGTRKNSWSSDIAVDDIRLYHCPNGPESAGETTPAPEPETTATTATTPTPVTTAAEVSQDASTLQPDASTPPEGGVAPEGAAEGGDASTGETSTQNATTTTSDESTTATDASITTTTEDTTTGSGSTDGTSHGSEGQGQENSTVLTFDPSRRDGDGARDSVAGGDGIGAEPAANQPGETGRNQARAAAASASTQILPVVIGVMIAVIVAVVFLAVVVWAVSRRKAKRDTESEDELKIINK